jgi:hypothetical protein
MVRQADAGRQARDNAAHTAGRVAPARITRAGRPLITRAYLARLSGLTVSTLTNLYRERVRTGHPDAVCADPEHGFALYFDEEATLRWHHNRWRNSRHGRDSHQANYRARPGLLDRAGEPAELISTTEAARILGYHGPATIRAYLSRYPGYFPSPDHIQTLNGGRRRMLWRRATIWAYAEHRTPRTHRETT